MDSLDLQIKHFMDAVQLMALEAEDLIDVSSLTKVLENLQKTKDITLQRSLVSEGVQSLESLKVLLAERVRASKTIARHYQ